MIATLSLPLMVVVLAGIVGLIWWVNAEPSASAARVPAAPRRRDPRPEVAPPPTVELDDPDEEEP